MSLLVTASVCGVLILLSPEYEAARWGAMAAAALLTAQAGRFRHQSRRDDLTGLYNLRQLEAMVRHYRLCPELGVWYFDLDHLKLVNDCEGHSAGDRLLVTFAAQLRGCKRRGSRAYRIGGDEFLMILPYPPGDSTPPLPDVHDLPASWGYAAGRGSQLRELIVCAERGMYENRRRSGADI